MTHDEAGPVEGSQIQRIVEECEERLRRGENVDHDALLAAHPELRPLLDEVLSGLDFVRRAAPVLELDGQSADLRSPPIKQLGDFVLQREIGRGGMGFVYEAEQVSLGRRVAVKLLPFFGQIDPKRLRRFRIEVQAAAQLHHTNIVPVHFVGEERGIHYYVMQLIEGQPLSRIIEDLRRLETQKGTTSRIAGLMESSSSTRSREYYQSVARIGIQAARALEHAHAMGIVHRDVKPSNLLLDTRGQLWVTDFGLARVQASGSLTRSGEVLGTLRYMSPEQALGRADIDERTDIYSLGATLAELASLEDLYPGDDREEIVRRVISEDVRRVSASGKPVARDLETVLLKCLAKSPSERYASAADLARDLERYLEDRPIDARRPGPMRRAWKWARRNRALTAAVALALTLAAIGAVASYGRYRAARESEYRELVESAVLEAQAGLLCARFGPGFYQRGAIHRYFLGLSSSVSASGPAEKALVKLDRAARLLTDDPAAPYHSARILYLLQRETHCKAALEQALAAGLSFAPALELRRSLEEKKDVAAPAAVSRLSSRELESIEERLWIEAYRSAAEGRWPAAAKAYADLFQLTTSKAESYTGSREEILLGLGATRLEAGDHYGALEAFAIAESKWPDAVTPGLFKAKVYYFLEQDERAEATFRQLVERRKGDAALVEEILIFYYLYFDHEKVTAWLKELPPGYSREIIEALLTSEVAGLGTSSDVSRWWQRAIEAAERASRYRPEAGVAHAIRGIALLRGQGKVEAGEAAFARARELAPDDGVVLHFYAAALNGNSKTRRRALEAWEEAAALSPWFPYAWIGVADAASLLGDHAKCETAYRRGFELDPANSNDRVFYGIALRRAGKYSEAEKQFLEAVGSNPRLAFAWGWLALHYGDTHRGAEALAACERAMRLDPSDEFARFLAGELLERLGKPIEAERPYRETVALGGPRRGAAYQRLAWLSARQGRLDESLAVVIEWLRVDPAAACKGSWLLSFIRRHGLTDRFLAKASELEEIFRASGEAQELRNALVPVPAETETRREAAAPTAEWPAGELERLAHGETLRLNCGGQAIEPVAGERWLADRFFAGGQAARTWVDDVRDTDRDEVYRSQRYEETAPSFAYHIPVPTGKYRVRLHFAETWYYVSGQRRFTVKIEDSTILGMEIPPAAAMVRQVEVEVDDHSLDVILVPDPGDPMICGIEIERSR